MIENEDKYFYGLNAELKQLADTDWVRFCKLLGEDGLKKLKICFLVDKPRSLGYIAQKLNLPKSTVQTFSQKSCNKCSENKKL